MFSRLDIFTHHQHYLVWMLRWFSLMNNDILLLTQKHRFLVNLLSNLCMAHTLDKLATFRQVCKVSDHFKIELNYLLIQ
jgi:hypothetical protein